RNLPSPSSPNVNFDALPVQPTLHPPPPNVNLDALPVQLTLPPPSPNVSHHKIGIWVYPLFGIGTAFLLGIGYLIWKYLR
ncbi:hypothetical protein A2U01_0037115, partial [Trifolium medium]|nr:hypothetical protein [Trifolium medium]